MAKKGNRIQVILECTEHKTTNMPGMSRYITTKKYDRAVGAEKVQSDLEKIYRT